MPEFSPGESKMAVVPMTNPTVKAFDYSAELYMGTDLALMARKDFHLEAGEEKDISLPIIMPSVAGTYPVHIGVFSSGVSIGLYKAVEDVVIAAPIAGIIDPGYIWHEPLVGWGTLVSGREIPLNEEIHLAPGWMNESEIAIIGHVNLAVTYPDGTKAFLSAVLNQDKEAVPHNGWHVQFQPFLSTQEGTYTLEAIFSSAGQVLDSVTFTLVAVAVALPFTFSGVWARRVRCESATAWNTLDFGCTISNPTDRSITHTLTPMYRIETKYGLGDPRAYCDLVIFTLTLNPGQSYNCTVKANYYDAEDRRWRCAVLLGFSAGVPYGGCAFLRDENGNDSPQACAGL